MKGKSSMILLSRTQKRNCLLVALITFGLLYYRYPQIITDSQTDSSQRLQMFFVLIVGAQLILELLLTYIFIHARSMEAGSKHQYAVMSLMIMLYGLVVYNFFHPDDFSPLFDWINSRAMMTAVSVLYFVALQAGLLLLNRIDTLLKPSIFKDVKKSQKGSQL
jgi:magnesium-transporting ATPase (P-type)